MNNMITTREEILKVLKSIKTKVDYISPMGNHLVLNSEGLLDEDQKDNDIPAFISWDDMDIAELKEWHSEYLKINE